MSPHRGGETHIPLITSKCDRVLGCVCVGQQGLVLEMFHSEARVLVDVCVYVCVPSSVLFNKVVKKRPFRRSEHKKATFPLALSNTHTVASLFLESYLCSSQHPLPYDDICITMSYLTNMGAQNLTIGTLL